MRSRTVLPGKPQAALQAIGNLHRRMGQETINSGPSLPSFLQAPDTNY